MARKQNFKRRPNKSGTVIKLSGNRSKPYIAKVTIGYDEITGNQKQKAIGYFETRQEALDALTIYSLSNNKNVSASKLQLLGGDIYEQVMEVKNQDLPTFNDLYLIVYNKNKVSFSISRIKALNSAYQHLKPIHDLKIIDIDLFKMQQCIDQAREKVGSKVLADMKTICVKIFEYAIIHQYIDRNKDFTSYLDASKKENKPSKHKSFTLDEIHQLIENNSLEAKIVLIFIFTGARPIELLTIDTKNIHIDEDGISYMIAGSKTDAGKDRVIPIHDFIKPFVIELLKKHKSYLIMKDCNHITMAYRIKSFAPLMEELNLNHTPYDTRHTFATLTKIYKVDDFARKRIMGHKSNDLTDDTYTHTFKQNLYDEINKIQI